LVLYTNTVNIVSNNDRPIGELCCLCTNCSSQGRRKIKRQQVALTTSMD